MRGISSVLKMKLKTKIIDFTHKDTFIVQVLSCLSLFVNSSSVTYKAIEIFVYIFFYFWYSFTLYIMKFLYIITFSNEKNELFLHFNIEGFNLWEPFKVKWDPALQIWSLPPTDTLWSLVQLTFLWWSRTYFRISRRWICTNSTACNV